MSNIPNRSAAGLAPSASPSAAGPGRPIDIVLLLIAAAAMFVLSTRHGIGILPDSTRYMSLVDDPYDAPVYAWLLEAGTWLGATLGQTAYALALFFLCGNVWLIWRMLDGATQSRAAAAFGTALALFCPVFLGEQTVAMSEGPFIFSILITLFALLRYWKTERRIWLLWCGIGIGVSTLVRFTAPPLGAAIALILLITPRHPFMRRVADAATVGVAGAVIFLGWTVLSQLAVGRSIGRELAFHGHIDAQRWWWSLDSMTSMLLPTQVPLIARAAVLIALVAGGAVLCIWQAGRALREAAVPQQGARLLGLTLGLFFVCYMAFLYLAFALEANQHYTTRYLLPVYVTSVIMVTILLAEAAGAAGWIRQLRRGLIVLAVVVLAGHLVRSVDRVRDAYADGVGFANARWVNSPVVRAAGQLPRDAIIYTNGPDALAWLLQRRVRMTPHAVHWRTNQPDPLNPLPAQMARARADLAEGKTYFVMLDGIDWRHYLVTEGELKTQLGLKLVRQEKDGRIYTGQR